MDEDLETDFQPVKPYRVDGPHPVGKPAVEPVAELVASHVGSESSAVGTLDPPWEEPTSDADWSPAGTAELQQPDVEAREEQLEHQAAQLASHLQAELQTLERRESQLNARTAELENELRVSSLRAQDKLAELAEREQALSAGEAALAEKELLACERLEEQVRQHEARYVEMEARQALLDSRETKFAEWEQKLTERDNALVDREEEFAEKESLIRERRQSIEREAAALQHSRQDWERTQTDEQAELSHQRECLRQEIVAELARREQMLSAGEILLAEHTRQLDNDRQLLAHERADWQRQKTTDREAIALHRHRAESELEQRRTRLAARETAIDKQQAALDQLRSEITAAHRQSIEMRLIAEQLWGQMQGRMPPAEITQALAQLRLKLSEQYRLEQQGLSQQKEELLRLAEKVAEQSAALRGQRQELQAWFTAREQEIERHAESLVNRECEVQERDERIRQQADAWQSDRRNLEEQVRELHGQLRNLCAAA